MPRGVTCCSPYGVASTAIDSYTTPRLSFWRSIVEPRVWEAISHARRVLGYSEVDDCFAARELERLLFEALAGGRYAGLDMVCSRLRGLVCVAGGSESLLAELGYLYSCDTVVAADGATTLLADWGVEIDVIVGDLDGRLHDILVEAANGAIVVVHSHGDNLSLVKYAAPLLPCFAGVSQCRSHHSFLQLPVLGFTDGDKAVGLALLCGAERVALAGMDFVGKVGWWSKPWLRSSVRAWGEKRVKLLFARELVEVYRKVGRVAGVEIGWIARVMREY